MKNRIVSGSEKSIYVNDPVTSKTYTVIINSLPSASVPGQELGYVVTSGYLNLLAESNFLNKILTIPLNLQTEPVKISNNGINWTGSYKWIETDSGYNRAYAIAVSEELKVISAIAFSEGFGNSYAGGPVYSYDAYNWFTGSMDTYEKARSMCYSPQLQRFVAVGYDTTAWYSNNGINWIRTTSSRLVPGAGGTYTTDPAGCRWGKVTWDSVNGKFIAVGDRLDAGLYNTGSVMTSSDGISWSINKTVFTGSVINTSEIRDVASGNGTTVALSGNYELLTSTDGGSNWTTYILPDVTSCNTIVYSSDLNKFYIPFYSSATQNDDFLYFYTSSNGTDWGIYASPLNPTFNGGGQGIPRMIWSTNLQKFISVNPNTYSDSSGLNFINANESDVANVQFVQTPNNTVFSNVVSSYTSSAAGIGDEYISFETKENAIAWIEFDLNLDGGDPYGSSGNYVGTASLGIIIDSSSLVGFTSSMGGAEDIEIDGIRYLQELEGVSEEYHVGYYEKSGLTVTSASISTFSASLKSAGRDYVTMWYGIYQNSTFSEDEVALILNLKDGIVEYQEDAFSSGNYGLTYSSELVFLDKPKLTDKTNGYWELTFTVGYNNYVWDLDVAKTTTLGLTETNTTIPYVFSVTSGSTKVITPQSQSTLITPTPHHWWRADYGLTTSGWTAASGSVNFQFSGVTTANSTVGAYFSQSFGSSSVLSSDINVKHIFLRADNILPRGAIFGGTVNDFQQMLFYLGAGNNWVITEYSKSNAVNSSYQATQIRTGSKLTYIDFEMWGMINNLQIPSYTNNWNPAYYAPQFTGGPTSGKYTYQYTWPSGSKIIVGRRQYNDAFSYANLYIKEIAIFTSSISIGEAHKFSQEMLQRWP